MGLVFLADTSAYSEFLRGGSVVSHYFSAQTEKIYLPFILIAEIYAGAKNGSRMAENERALEALIEAPNTEALFPSLKTAEIYGELVALLKRTGQPIGSNDIWIAALAIEHELPLLTADRDFGCIPGLKLL